jgi:hypothetical protein
MKKILFFLLSIIVISCSSDKESENQEPSPTAKVNVSQPIFTQGNIKFNGEVVDIGSGYNTKGFCWSQNINPEVNSSENLYEYSTSLGVFFINQSYSTSFLTNTTYYVRAFMQLNNGEYVYSENLSFVTPPKMNFNNNLAKNIYTTSATLDGTILVNYIEPISPDEKGFCYKTSSGVTILNGSKKSITTNDYSALSLEITSLLSNTTYYVKSFVREGSNVYYSDEFTFKTAGAIGTSGGYIYFDKGEYSDGWRYLEAGPNNLIYNNSNKIYWGCTGGQVNQTQSGMGFGQANTTRIVSQCSDANCAARLCDNYAINGVTDWFLPSEDELMAFYKSANNVYTIATASYFNDYTDRYFWSSTEATNLTDAKYLDAYNGYFTQYSKNYNLVRVRPVRRF